MLVAIEFTVTHIVLLLNSQQTSTSFPPLVQGGKAFAHWNTYCYTLFPFNSCIFQLRDYMDLLNYVCKFFKGL